MAGRATTVKCMNTVKCNDFEAVYKCIADHEEQYRVKFITAHKDKEFGSINEHIPDPSKAFLRWCLDYGGQSPKIECDGVPFFYMHRHVLICHQGRDRNEKTKAKRKALVQSSSTTNQESTPKKKRRLVQDTKKVGCPASVYVVQVLRVIDYRVQFKGLEPTGHTKLMIKRQLRDKYMTDASSIGTETAFYISFPLVSTHQGHPVNNIAAGMREALDPRILHKISELTSKGILKVSEVRKHLEKYVNSTLFHSSELPERTRRRYYPTDVDIRNAIQKAKKEVHTKVDQHNVSMMLSQWKQQYKDSFEYRPLRPGFDQDKFLFCCQTRWQSRLLNQYGNPFTVLNAVYRNAGYSLPLFLLSVRTNVGYTVVGMFVSHSDTAEDIAEALGVFRRWNPAWKPEGFVVDYYEPEIEATEMVFPGCRALFAYHRCEALWHDWLRDSSGISDDLLRARIIKTLRRITMATTDRELECGLKGLRTMAVWKENEAMAQWFNLFWLSCMKRWALVYQNERVRVALYAVNGLKQQTDMFNHTYVSENRDSSLSEIITILYTKCFPAEYRKYVEFNTRYSSSYLKYSSDVPAFLHSKPRFIVEQVEKSMTNITKPENIQDCQDGRFIVKGARNQMHQVFFGDAARYPSCTCSRWTKLFLPCNHFCAIFQHVPGWSWDQLGASYRDNPLFLLDEDVLLPNDPMRQPQGIADDKAKGQGNVVSENTGEDGEKAPTEAASRSKRPQRGAATCKHLVKKNMALLEKLEMQVPYLKNKDFLEDMLKTLQSLVHRVQSVRKLGRKSAAMKHKSTSVKRNKKFANSVSTESKSHIEEISKRNPRTIQSSENVQITNGDQLSDNNATTLKSASLSSGESIINNTHEVTVNIVTETNEITCSRKNRARLASPLQIVPNADIQSKAPEDIQNDIETIIIQSSPYMSNLLPFRSLEDTTQGAQRTVEGQHGLQGNVMVVAEDLVLGQQEILSTEGLITETVDQIGPGSFIIDTNPRGITVTLTDTHLDRSSSLTSS